MMPYFDRFDICAAYLAVEWDWHTGGMLPERPSNARRNESTAVQLARIGFRPGAAFRGFESLTDNGKEIYRALCERYGFDVTDDAPSGVTCAECGPAGCWH